MKRVLTACLSKAGPFSGFFLLVGFCASLYSQTETPQQLYEISATKYMLGTQIDFKAMCDEVLAGKQAFYCGFQEIARIEDLLSSHKPGSEITEINRNAGLSAVKVGYETLSILRRAVTYAQKFNGMFDVSIGPVTELWGFNSDREVTVPEAEKLKQLLRLVNYRNIVLNEADTTVFLQRPGMSLDLGGIAKGYAIDRAASTLKQKGLTRFLINAGGDIYAFGYKEANKEWVIGIQHPRKPQELLATAEIHNVAVATSGDYERYKVIDDKRYCHIMNPRTGSPANLCQSVTVFAQTAEEADACATFLFVVGKDWQNSALLNHPIRSFIVDSGGNIFSSPSVKKQFKLNTQL